MRSRASGSASSHLRAALLGARAILHERGPLEMPAVERPTRGSARSRAGCTVLGDSHADGVQALRPDGERMVGFKGIPSWALERNPCSIGSASPETRGKGGQINWAKFSKIGESRKKRWRLGINACSVESGVAGRGLVPTFAYFEGTAFESDR
jgi:hypothetical protein